MGELEQRNKAIVERFGQAQSARRLDLLEELIEPAFVRHCQATPYLDIRSRDEFMQFMQDDWAAVTDGRIAPRLMLAEGDYVAVHGEYTGKQTGQWGPVPPTNLPFVLDFLAIFRLHSGRIAELWITWDNLALLSQLGQWPPG